METKETKVIATYTFYKHSNTGELVMQQHFSNISYTSPDFFYDGNRDRIEEPSLKGFVKISEKTFNRLAKRKNKEIDNNALLKAKEEK